MAQRIKRWKGHCMMCNAYTIRGTGQAAKRRFSELRRIGKKRRISRHDPGDMLE